MSINEPRPFHAAEDWAVVIQSVPSKSKKETVKRLVEIFELDKRDAEQILSNVPLMFLDNLSFGLAVRIKKYFQKLGAVAETTNHDVIKKNCMQVLWPQAPDLSYFMKNELGPAEAAFHGPEGETLAEGKPFDGDKESGTEMPKIHKGSPFARPESAPPLYPPIPPKPAPDLGNVSPFSASEKKAPAPSLSGEGSGMDHQTEELNEKIRQAHLEKQLLQTRHASEVETMKRQVEAEKQKASEMARVNEDLRKEAQRFGALGRETEEWRAKAAKFEEKVNELEKSLAEKQKDMGRQSEASQARIAALEQKIHGLESELAQKQPAGGHEEEALRKKAAALESKIAELENSLAQKDAEFGRINLQKEGVLRQFEEAVSQTQQEIISLRQREQDYVQKIEALEHSVQQMTESLRYRDQVLAEFEKQISELFKTNLPPGSAH